MSKRESPSSAPDERLYKAIKQMLDAHWTLYSEHWKHVPTLSPDDDICRRELIDAVVAWRNRETLPSAFDERELKKEMCRQACANTDKYLDCFDGEEYVESFNTMDMQSSFCDGWEAAFKLIAGDVTDQSAERLKK
jgi:hypothetical protein